MFARSPSSMSPFLHDRIVLRPTNTPLPIVMPRVGVALGVEQAVVVDDDVVADADLARMPQHDVLAEHDVAAAGAEQPRIQHLAQRQPEGARHPLAHQRDEFVLDERATSPGRPTTSAAYLSRADVRASNSCSCAFGMSAIRATPARGTTPASAGCPRAGRRAGRTPVPARARAMSNARLFVKKSTRRRYSGGSMPSGTQTASHTAPATQTGHTGRRSDGGADTGLRPRSAGPARSASSPRPRPGCRCGPPPPARSPHSRNPSTRSSM